ncbi:hypothetical protein [Aequorivita antarctica]|uniref:Lipoprotein n=1 Tax=Aequorivita antarctica TaxID=153266 RepID=A0A5C6YYT6_9FLAO|nr:hypothetical protein [Aequorivita antarctica]TXD72789.1 hypothetical protein ESU54_11270 [Aequorivita antarctica]SRX76208.1 hypothetical protein AEQU3_03207 [Aequorivita antarctica]
MKTYKFLIFILLISFYSCNQKVNSKDNLKKIQTDELINNLKLNSNKIHNNSFSTISVIVKEKDKVEIEYVFNKSEIVNPIQQKLFLSYLLYTSEILRRYKDINFTYFVNGEKFNAKNFFIDEKAKINILENLNYLPFNKMLFFCLNNFNSETIYDLNIWIENVYKVYPNEALNTDFFSLLEKLSMECSNESNSKDAKVTLVLMYVAIKDAIENGTLTKVMLDSQKYSLMMIEKLWGICENGEKIEFAEQRLFGRVGNNWVPN